MLMASGTLDLAPAEGSIVQKIGDGDIGRNLRPSQFAVASAKRSVYLPIVRGAVPEMLQVFDFPDPSIIFGQREVTTVPTQSLYMMNSPFVIEQSKIFAQRILDEGDLSAQERVKLAYQWALSRLPTSDEAAAAEGYLRDARASLAEDASQSAVQSQVWASFLPDAVCLLGIPLRGLTPHTRVRAVDLWELPRTSPAMRPRNQ